MTAFNALYYSFSPAIAQSISESEWMRFVVRMVLYPLIAILHVSTVVFDALSSAPEVAIITAGLVASGLIGACYLAPVVTGIRMALWRRRRIHVPSGVLLGVWSSTIVLMVFAEALAEPTLMMCATAGFVLATLAASTLCVSGRIVQRIAR